jgi:Kdo2-lipid IVA lauroyltransferase/acyltransferase
VKVPLAKRVKRYLRYCVVRAALFGVEWLPIQVAGRLGEALGSLAFRLASKTRRTALESLARAFPEWSAERRRALACSSFQHLGRCAFELACIGQLDPRIGQWVEWNEQERGLLENALARGRGVLFVSGHVGNWELLARRVALAGLPASTIAKESSDWRLTRLVERFRIQGRVESIWRGQQGAAKRMLRVLKSGGILGFLIDQDTAVQSIFVPFFGHPAATPRAAADLALKTGAAVVVGFCQRKEDGRYRLSMKEILPRQTGDAENDVVALTQDLTAEIESAIRRTPEQWVWMHRRWKSQPC